MPCHLDPQQLALAMAQNQKGKQALKCDCWNHANVDGGDRPSVITQKCLPGLRGRRSTPHHVLEDSRLSDLKAKHQELAMDPRRAPQRVLPAHPADKITQAATDLRPPCPLSRFPAPIDLKPSSSGQGRLPESLHFAESAVI